MTTLTADVYRVLAPDGRILTGCYVTACAHAQRLSAEHAGRTFAVRYTNLGGKMVTSAVYCNGAIDPEALEKERSARDAQ